MNINNIPLNPPNWEWISFGNKTIIQFSVEFNNQFKFIDWINNDDQYIVDIDYLITMLAEAISSKLFFHHKNMLIEHPGGALPYHKMS